MSRELVIIGLLGISIVSVVIGMYSTTNDLKKVNARAKSYMDTALGKKRPFESNEPIEETQR